jgi:hypothetical protein
MATMQILYADGYRFKKANYNIDDYFIKTSNFGWITGVHRNDRIFIAAKQVIEPVRLPMESFYDAIIDSACP